MGETFKCLLSDHPSTTDLLSGQDAGLSELAKSNRRKAEASSSLGHAQELHSQKVQAEGSTRSPRPTVEGSRARRIAR